MLMIQTKMPEPAWTVPLVALLLIGMLATFYAVVSNATKAGELRRQATATQAAEVTRCNALPSWNASRNCLKNLDSKGVEQEPVLLAAK